MAGYAKSVVFPASSTLPELVIAAFGGEHPELAYKIYVLVSAAAVPWLIALACARLDGSARRERRSPSCSTWSTSGPTSRSITWRSGCCPISWAIPLALVATGAFARFLTRGGAINWLIAAALMSLAVLVHLTTAMVVVPAAALAYLARRLQPSGRPLARPDRRPPRLSVAGLGSRTTADPAASRRRLADPGRRAGGQRLLVAAGDLAGVDQGAERLRVLPSRGRDRPAGADRLVRRRRSSASCWPPGCPGLPRAVRRDRDRGLGAGWASAPPGCVWGYLAGGLRAARFLAARATYLRVLHRRWRSPAPRHSTSCSGGSAPVPTGIDHLDRWVIGSAVGI